MRGSFEYWALATTDAELERFCGDRRERHFDYGRAICMDCLQLRFCRMVGMNAGGNRNHTVQCRTELLRDTLRDQVIFVRRNGGDPAVATDRISL